MADPTYTGEWDPFLSQRKQEVISTLITKMTITKMKITKMT